MKKIEKIIFDYGGVISSGSRKNIIIEKLSNNNSEYKSQLEKLFSSDMLLDFATGKCSEKVFYDQISLIINCDDVDKIKHIFHNSCIPDLDMIDLIKKLSINYKLFIVSDSLPPFTSFIIETYHALFEKMYFSDILKTRKSEKLFDKIIDINPHFFNNSIYIDDKVKNLNIPKKYGAKCFKYESVEVLNKDLFELELFI